MQNQDLLALMRDLFLKAAELAQKELDVQSVQTKSPEPVVPEPVVPEPVVPEPVVPVVPEPVVPVVPEPVVPEPVVPEPVKSVLIDKSLFPQDKQVLLELLGSSDWPEAAPQFLICEDSEDDKTERAEGILDYIGDNLEGKKVLDFGCGEGHVALKASETAGFVVGYDIIKPMKVGNDKCLLTDDFAKVAEKGPFDLIILYDVLDHSRDVAAVLKQVKSVSNSQTKIFVRCHSWMSRHGVHLYKQLNKAWVQLFFTEEELAKMGIKMDFARKYFMPIAEQNSWFKEAGLAVVSSDIIKTAVEPFFRRPEIASKIPDVFKGVFPEFQMSQVFNDYILRNS